LLTPSVRAVDVLREAPDRCAVGVETATRFTITNTRKWRRAGPLLLTDRAPSLETRTVYVSRLAPGVSASVVVHRPPQQRGRWPSGAVVTVDGCSLLGGFRRRRRLYDDRPTVVHPEPASALALADITDLRNSGQGAPSRRSGRGTDVLGLREWRPGDAVSAVSWRASASRGRLVALEREEPTSAQLMVAVGTAGDGQHWERALARAAATAVAALRGGQQLTLISGADVTRPKSVREALDWFASCEQPEASSAATVRAMRNHCFGPLIWLSTTTGQLTGSIGGAIGGVCHLGAPELEVDR
jgi:uncharacterized protein (DUF58 family)